MLIPAGYREPVLTPRAARNVEALWTFAATQQGCTVVLPDGRCDIILRFQASGPALPIPIITGPATRPYTVHFTRGESWIGLRLRPGLGAALWKDALNGRLNDVRRGADALAVIPDLNVALRNSGSSQEIEQALLSLPCIQNARPCAAMLQTALDTIHVSGGRMSISDLARICGCTTRHLGRLFHVGLGLSPKTYAQLVRKWPLKQATPITPTCAASCAFLAASRPPQCLRISLSPVSLGDVRFLQDLSFNTP